MGCASGFVLEKPCYGGKGIFRFGRRRLFPRGIYTTWSFMTHIDIKHSVFAQERLEWVAPKILLMEAMDTKGKQVNFPQEGNAFGPGGEGGFSYAPS